MVRCRTKVLIVAWVGLAGGIGAERALAAGSMTGVSGTGGVALKAEVRAWTAWAAEGATEEQRAGWGLRLPVGYDAGRPVVVLVHGLSSTAADCAAMRAGLEAEGVQVGTFAYPGDGPIEDSGRMFREALRAHAAEHPGAVVDVVAYSQGGLVARAAIEPESGRDVRVRRLVLVAVPNHGSGWVVLGPVLEGRRNAERVCRGERWRATWAVTDGLGESWEEMARGSAFLRRLNALPRRTDVAYTVIAGERSVVTEAATDVLDAAVAAGRDAQRAARVSARKARNLWSRVKYTVGASERLEHTDELRPVTGAGDALLARAEGTADGLRERRDLSDGPVDVASAMLEGVSDVVVLRATHAALWDGPRPAALEAVARRVGR